MKVKVFEFSKDFWSWEWKIDDAIAETIIAEWLANNPKVKIHNIFHQNIESFWHPAQLIVTIYYK
jgi:hypothetical protein